VASFIIAGNSALLTLRTPGEFDKPVLVISERADPSRIRKADEILAARQRRGGAAVCFPQEAFDSIARDGAAMSSTDEHGEARVVEPVR
jgi:hypothetical protein